MPKTKRNGCAKSLFIIGYGKSADFVGYFLRKLNSIGQRRRKDRARFLELRMEFNYATKKAIEPESCWQLQRRFASGVGNEVMDRRID